MKRKAIQTVEKSEAEKMFEKQLEEIRHRDRWCAACEHAIPCQEYTKEHGLCTWNVCELESPCEHFERRKPKVEYKRWQDFPTSVCVEEE